MTVDELRRQLAELDGSMLVVQSSDGEGNNYSPLAEVSTSAIYVPDSTWGGTLWDVEEYDCEGFDCDYKPEESCTCDPQPPPDAQPAIVLWPTN